MKVITSDLAERLTAVVVELYKENDRSVTLGEEVAIRSFLQMSAQAIINALEQD